VSDGLLSFDWNLPRGVRAAFTTRAGGASIPPWNSFNLGTHVGDEPSAVAANRSRLAGLLELSEEPAWLNQVHGTEVVDLDARPKGNVPATADASIATLPGRICVVMVADCLPVLFASRDGKRVAAAHAGWRGLVAGVLERTVSAMGIVPSELSAWLGPAISQPHFEVGDEVRDAFVAVDRGAGERFVPNERGRWQADLVGLAGRRLSAIGIKDVSGGEWCTFADRERFYSYRRDGKGGRMAALIWRTA
jgi:polyphenol oxidase